jgi:hypothetical protein
MLKLLRTITIASVLSPSLVLAGTTPPGSPRAAREPEAKKTRAQKFKAIIYPNFLGGTDLFGVDLAGEGQYQYLIDQIVADNVDYIRGVIPQHTLAILHLTKISVQFTMNDEETTEHLTAIDLAVISGAHEVLRVLLETAFEGRILINLDLERTLGYARRVDNNRAVLEIARYVTTLIEQTQTLIVPEPLLALEHIERLRGLSRLLETAQDAQNLGPEFAFLREFNKHFRDLETLRLVRQRTYIRTNEGNVIAIVRPCPFTRNAAFEALGINRRDFISKVTQYFKKVSRPNLQGERGKHFGRLLRGAFSVHLAHFNAHTPTELLNLWAKAMLQRNPDFVNLPSAEEFQLISFLYNIRINFFIPDPNNPDALIPDPNTPAIDETDSPVRSVDLLMIPYGTDPNSLAVHVDRLERGATQMAEPTAYDHYNEAFLRSATHVATKFHPAIAALLGLICMRQGNSGK